jgi:hypothetical protein
LVALVGWLEMDGGVLTVRFTRDEVVVPHVLLTTQS